MERKDVWRGSINLKMITSERRYRGYGGRKGRKKLRKIEEGRKEGEKYKNEGKKEGKRETKWLEGIKEA